MNPGWSEKFFPLKFQNSSLFCSINSFLLFVLEKCHLFVSLQENLLLSIFPCANYANVPLLFSKEFLPIIYYAEYTVHKIFYVLQFGNFHDPNEDAETSAKNEPISPLPLNILFSFSG